MGDWDNFAVIAGGASAALTGLLFVAVSIRVDVISASGELRNRAAQVLALFITVTILAILVTVPGQPLRVLGAELLALAVVTGGALFVLDRRAERSSTGQPLAHTLDVISPNTVTSALIGVSGLLLLADLRWGLYFDVVAVVAALIGGVVSAWLFMMRLGAARTGSPT